MRPLAILVAIFAFLHSTAATPAVGDWFVSDGAKLRLVTLRDGTTGKISAALQIVMESGWKTYWRSPGSSGLPPQLDFSQSQNVAGVEVRYPTPIAFKDSSGLTSGYKNEVIFPVDIQTPFPQRDVVLKLRGLVGVCRDICIPVQFSTQVTSRADAGSSLEAAEILARARESIPVQSSDDVHIVSVGHGAGKLDIVARVPASTSEATLFLEGPFNWYLAPSKAADIAGGRATFSVEIPDKVSPETAAGQTLRATLVVDGQGFEQEIAPR